MWKASSRNYKKSKNADTDIRKELRRKRNMKLGIHNRYQKEKQTALENLKITEQKFIE